jgi:hypothetical protein
MEKLGDEIKSVWCCVSVLGKECRGGSKSEKQDCIVKTVYVLC